MDLCKYLKVAHDQINLLKTEPKTRNCSISINYDDSTIYHPITHFLRNNGFHVCSSNTLSSEETLKAKVNIYFTTKDQPLDIGFGENHNFDFGNINTLKVYLLDNTKKNAGR